MKQRNAAVSFLLSFSAIVAVGAGALVFFASGGNAQAEEQAPRIRATRVAATPEVPAVAATPIPDATPEHELLAGEPVIPRPDLPHRLVIPAIGLDTKVLEVGIVVENGKPVWDTAAFAAGYHRGSALPGTRGNTVMAGHISSPVSKKGEVFKHLPEVRVGDRIDVFVGERRFTYEVAEIRVVAPAAVQVMEPTPEPVLTLITCYPDRSYAKRLVVISRLVPPV